MAAHPNEEATEVTNWYTMSSVSLKTMGSPESLSTIDRYRLSD